MARGFFKGMLFGGIIGAMVAVFSKPELKPMRRMKRLVGPKTQKNVKRIFRTVRKGINDMRD